jgi:hypothetical protein
VGYIPTFYGEYRLKVRSSSCDLEGMGSIPITHPKNFKKERLNMSKLSDKKIEKIIKEYPDQTFDICSVCDGVELRNQMNEINEVDWDLICNECLEKKRKRG